MKTICRVMQPFTAYLLMPLIFVPSFKKNISKGFKVIKGTHTEIYKGYATFHCILSDDPLFVLPSFKKISPRVSKLLRGHIL